MMMMLIAAFPSVTVTSRMVLMVVVMVMVARRISSISFVATPDMSVMVEISVLTFPAESTGSIPMVPVVLRASFSSLRRDRVVLISTAP